MMSVYNISRKKYFSPVLSVVDVYVPDVLCVSAGMGTQDVMIVSDSSVYINWE